MTGKITESSIETFAIELLEKQEYHYIYGPNIAPDSEKDSDPTSPPSGGRGASGVRSSFEDVLLLENLKTAVTRINPTISDDAREDAVRQIQRLNSPELIANNEAFHRMLTEGIKVTYQKDGHSRGDLVWLIDFNDPDNNDFLVINQFTVINSSLISPLGDKGAWANKRPDVIIFINGLPLVVMELKNAVDENATIHSAFKQFRTYKDAIPSLFVYNGFLIISDGLEAKAGTISSGYSRFMAWKSSDGRVEASHLIGPDRNPD